MFHPMNIANNLNSPNLLFSLAMQDFCFKVTEKFQISNYEHKISERTRDCMCDVCTCRGGQDKVE